MFGKRRKNTATYYDKSGKVPVIRSSICTGEKVAGFKDSKTGTFEEIMLIRSDTDLQEFMGTYDVAASEIKHEW